MTNLQKIESECRQKLQKLDSEYDPKLIPYRMSGSEGLSGLPGPIFGDTLTAERRAKVEAILTEYHLQRAAIVAEREARLADERNRTAKARLPGKDRASYRITVTSEANRTPVSLSCRSPSTALTL